MWLCLETMQCRQTRGTETLALKGTPVYAPGEQSVNCAVYVVRSRSLVRFHKGTSQQLAGILDFLGW